MPYIREARRYEVRLHQNPVDPGELNYLITTMLAGYLEDKGLSYATINDIVGVLESAKLEFYRRVAAPYEDKKKEENGDVYRSV